MPNETLNDFKIAVEAMVEAYGNCSCDEVENSGLGEMLEAFTEEAIGVMNKLDEVI